MASGQHRGGCPFDQLDDELLQRILEKGAEKHDAHLEVWPLPAIPAVAGEGHWVFARSLGQLSAVCKRFRALNALAAARHVFWDFSDTPGSMVGVQAVTQMGPHLRSLALHYTRTFDGDLVKVQVCASIELLTAILRQCTNLRVFALLSGQSPRTEEASSQLWKLLAALPLETVLLEHSGFAFQVPLGRTLAFNNLLEVRLEGATISDHFLHSLLTQAPALKVLSLKYCPGLHEPKLKSCTLEKLDFFRAIIRGNLVINAPNLHSFKGVPRLSKLILKAPKLTSLTFTGAVESLELGNRKFSLTELRFEGGNWHVSNVEALLQKFESLDEVNLDINVEYWAIASERRPLSTFLQILPSTVSECHMGTVVGQLYETINCSQALESIRFALLKSIQFSIKNSEDFRLMTKVLSCCPNLRALDVDLRHITGPIDGLAKRAIDLQTCYPDVEITFQEPPHYVSSAHLLDTIDFEIPATSALKTLVDELGNNFYN